MGRSDRKRARAVLAVAVPLGLLLLCCSSRAGASTSSLLPDGKRPAPSTRNLPEDPVPISEAAEGGADAVQPEPLALAPDGAESTPGASPTTRGRLRSECTKPDYLRFFKTAGFQNLLAPPG